MVKRRDPYYRGYIIIRRIIIIRIKIIQDVITRNWLKKIQSAVQIDEVKQVRFKASFK